MEKEAEVAVVEVDAVELAETAAEFMEAVAVAEAVGAAEVAFPRFLMDAIRARRTARGAMGMALLGRGVEGAR